MEFKYYVVKLVELPSNHINSYVCVPRSWIKIILDKLPEEQKILISYPEEDPQKTKKRVKNEEVSDKSWRHLWGTVAYKSDNYQDAERWITSGGVDPNDSNGAGYPFIGNPPAEGATAEPHSYQQTSSANPIENTLQNKDVSSKNHSNSSIKLSLKRNLQSHNADEFYIKQLRIDDKAEGGKAIPNNVCQPVVNPHELINIHQANTSQETRKQDIIPTAVVGQSPYHSGHPQTAMPSNGLNSINSHNQSCQLTDNLLHNYGMQEADGGQSVDINHSGQGSYLEVTNPSIQTATSPTSQSCEIAEQSHQKRISVVSKEYLFQNYLEQEVANERVIKTNSNHEKSQSDMSSTQSPRQVLANHSDYLSQSSDYRHQKQSVPIDHLQQNHVKQKVDCITSPYRNDCDQRPNTLSKNSPSAVQALKTLMNRHDEQRNTIQKHQFMKPYESPRQDVFGKANESVHIDKKSYLEDIKKIKSSPAYSPKYTQQVHINERVLPEIDIKHTLHTNKVVSSNGLQHNVDKKPPNFILRKRLSLEDSLSDITNKSCQLVEQSHLKRDASGYNVHVHINKIVVSRSSDKEGYDQIASPECATKSASSNLQNISSFVTEPNPLYEKSYENQDSPEYRVVVQQHPQINKIIITKTNEMDSNNEIPHFQNDTSYGQNAVEDSQSSDGLHEKNYTNLPNGYTQVNPGTPKRIVRTTAAGIPYIVNDYFPENVKNPPPTIQPCSNIENQSCQQLSKALNDQHSAISQNCPAQVPRREVTDIGRNAADRSDPKNRLQSIKKHKHMHNIPTFLENKLGQFTQRLHEKQSLLMGNEHLLQNQGTGIQFARQCRNMNNYDQRVCFQDTTKYQNPNQRIPYMQNPPSQRQFIQNPPSQRLVHVQNPPNQTRHPLQMPQNLHESQFQSVLNNRLFQESGIPQSISVKQVTMNNIPQRGQPIPQNMPVAQNVSNCNSHLPCPCKCSNAKQIGPIFQDQSCSDPRMQQTVVGRANEGHFIKQVVNPQTNGPFSMQNAFNTPKHPSQSFVNPIQENYRPPIVEPTAPEICTQEITATRYIDGNGIAQIIYHGNKKDDRQPVAQKNPNVSDQSLQYPTENHVSPTFKAATDHNMPQEVIYLEESNDSNYIKQINHHTMHAEVPSAVRQNGSNVENFGNSKVIPEHVLMNDLKGIIRKMDSNLCKTYALIDNANKIFVDYAESFKRTMKVVNEYYGLKINEAEKKAKDKRHKKKKPEKYRSDDEEHSNNN